MSKLLSVLKDYGLSGRVLIYVRKYLHENKSDITLYFSKEFYLISSLARFENSRASIEQESYLFKYNIKQEQIKAMFGDVQKLFKEYNSQFKKVNYEWYIDANLADGTFNSDLTLDEFKRIRRGLNE